MFDFDYSLLIGLLGVLYVSGCVSHFFATMAMQNVTKSLEVLIKSPKARKELNILRNETKRQLKLSFLWPYAIFLIIRKQ
jgi:hypothetical protein